MLRRIDELEDDLSPQAIFGRPVESIVQSGVIRSADDFDLYEGASFTLDDEIPFAIRRYRGHPPGTATLYLKSEVRDIDVITRLVERIVRELELDDSDLEWQRRDDPEL